MSLPYSIPCMYRFSYNSSNLSESSSNLRQDLIRSWSNNSHVIFHNTSVLPMTIIIIQHCKGSIDSISYYEFSFSFFYVNNISFSEYNNKLSEGSYPQGSVDETGRLSEEIPLVYKLPREAIRHGENNPSSFRCDH